MDPKFIYLVIYCASMRQHVQIQKME